MPSDEMVEKVAVIIRKRVRQRIEQDWDGMVYALDGVEDAAREIAALTAAIGPTQTYRAPGLSRRIAPKTRRHAGILPPTCASPSSPTRPERTLSGRLWKS